MSYVDWLKSKQRIEELEARVAELEKILAAAPKQEQPNAPTGRRRTPSRD